MKPKYRYNWKTGKLDEVFRVTSEVVEIPGFVNPKTGLRKSFVTLAGTAYQGMYGMDARQCNRIYNQSITKMVERG